jgi:hypothetical protein
MDVRSIIEEARKYESNDLESSINLGKLMVDSIWGSVDNWKLGKKGKEYHKFSEVIRDPDFPYRKSTTIRKMNIYMMDVHFSGLRKRWPNLYLSHFERAIYWDDKEKWLSIANEERLSVSMMSRRRTPPKLRDDKIPNFLSKLTDFVSIISIREDRKEILSEIYQILSEFGSDESGISSTITKENNVEVFPERKEVQIHQIEEESLENNEEDFEEIEKSEEPPKEEQPKEEPPKEESEFDDPLEVYIDIIEHCPLMKPTPEGLKEWEEYAISNYVFFNREKQKSLDILYTDLKFRVACIKAAEEEERKRRDAVDRDGWDYIPDYEMEGWNPITWKDVYYASGKFIKLSEELRSITDQDTKIAILPIPENRYLNDPFFKRKEDEKELKEIVENGVKYYVEYYEEPDEEEDIRISIKTDRGEDFVDIGMETEIGYDSEGEEIMVPKKISSSKFELKGKIIDVDNIDLDEAMDRCWKKFSGK